MRKFHCAVVSILALAVVVLAAATTDASAARKRVVVRKPAPVPAAAPASAPITAHGPDLIVLPDQTILTVNAKGCDVNEELFGGTVGVKNQGDGRADRLIVEPIVTVWIPEMLDMLDNKLVPNSLAPLEIFSTDVHVGKGKIKSGRGLTGKRKVYIMVDPYNKITETNEQNNLLVRELTFNCK